MTGLQFVSGEVVDSEHPVLVLFGTVAKPYFVTAVGRSDTAVRFTLQDSKVTRTATVATYEVEIKGKPCADGAFGGYGTTRKTLVNLAFGGEPLVSPPIAITCHGFLF